MAQGAAPEFPVLLPPVFCPVMEFVGNHEVMAFRIHQILDNVSSLRRHQLPGGGVFQVGPDVIVPENSGVGGHIEGIAPQVEVHDFSYSGWKIAVSVSETVSLSIPPQLHDTQVLPLPEGGEAAVCIRHDAKYLIKAEVDHIHFAGCQIHHLDDTPWWGTAQPHPVAVNGQGGQIGIDQAFGNGYGRESIFKRVIDQHTTPGGRIDPALMEVEGLGIDG
ncbi:hypothetical protein ES703_112341 [subsurface metagenome]